MKRCYKCKIEKTQDEFSKGNRAKDGLQSKCRSCYSAYFQENKIKMSDSRKEYREKNKEKISESKKQYAEANREVLNKKKKDYYTKNKDTLLAQMKIYYEANRDRKLQYIKEYRKKNKEVRNEYDKVYILKRRNEDPIFRLKANLRGRLNRYCKYSKLNKRFNTMDSLGISPSEFKVYIESMFVDGMSWDNYGAGNNKWSIDHTKPLCTATTEKEVFILNHYTNLRPMWWFDNLAKGGKYQEL
jgi:hypothetical protein